MAPTFGSRVVGNDEYEKAVREEKGGAHVFGTRVRDAIPDGGPTNSAKRASEFGVRTTDQASFQDHKGEETDAVAIDDLRNILAENPTFFDSLYEAELAREGGARPEALKIFQQVEIGIKGQGRRDVLSEIAALLGEKSQQSAARANLATAQKEQLAQMQERMKENALLVDAGRVKSLKERQENVQAVKDAGDDSSSAQITSTDTDAQVRKIASDKGLELPADVSTAASNVKGVPSKPGGPIHPETQAGGPRILAPKDGPGEGEGDEEGTGEQESVDYESMTKGELEDEASKLGVDVDGVKGTGADGAVLKADLLKAVKKAAKKQASE